MVGLLAFTSPGEELFVAELDATEQTLPGFATTAVSIAI